mmetsp:Transcript_38298/g.90335  ORF Transcript_38298/g.90335 Transcript_38298/m.90335 type:complete len:82 (+) Transcript_38298:127-372(+)
MFATLVQLHFSQLDLIDGLIPGSSALSAMGGGERGDGDVSSALAAKNHLTQSMISKEKHKAEEGYCETYLWNCTDLYGPGN